MNVEQIKVMLVLDPKLSKKDIFRDAIEAVNAGMQSIQYREKEKSSLEMLKECIQLREICGSKALFFVNDRVDLAFVSGADGVHLGQEDLPVAEAKIIFPNGLIGVTVHNVVEAVDAERDGADYVSVSPVFHTNTKSDAGKQVGLEMIRSVRAAVLIPVMGIGGINSGNAKSVIGAGADSISVVSCIVASDDVERETKKLLKAIE